MMSGTSSWRKCPASVSVTVPGASAAHGGAAPAEDGVPASPDQLHRARERTHPGVDRGQASHARVGGRVRHHAREPSGAARSTRRSKGHRYARATSPVMEWRSPGRGGASEGETPGHGTAPERAAACARVDGRRWRGSAPGAQPPCSTDTPRPGGRWWPGLRRAARWAHPSPAPRGSGRPVGGRPSRRRAPLRACRACASPRAAAWSCGRSRAGPGRAGEAAGPRART